MSDKEKREKGVLIHDPTEAEGLRRIETRPFKAVDHLCDDHGLQTKQKVLCRERAVAGARRRNHPCIRSGTGIAYLGAVVWTQFYSKSAYREAWCPIRHSPGQRCAGAFDWPGDQ